jgi:hypothetical protein
MGTSKELNKKAELIDDFLAAISELSLFRNLNYDFNL